MNIISATDSNINFIGRWGTKNYSGINKKVIVSGGGNPFKFKFSGTSLALTFVVNAIYAFNPILEYSIDGGAFTDKTIVTGANSIVSGLSSGTHTAEFWLKGIQQGVDRWTYPIIFESLTIDDGATISPWINSGTAKMLVLGDSIAEGLLITGNASTEDTQYSWGRKSFINQICTSLNIECWNHSFGGAGFKSATAGGTPTTDLNWNNICLGLGESDPRFNYIYIEVCNNDTGMDSTSFRNKYISMISALKTRYPGALIFCQGPLYPFAQDKITDVQYVASNTGSIWIDVQSLSYTYPNYNHPDLAGHNAIAASLLPIIKGYSSYILGNGLTSNIGIVSVNLSGSGGIQVIGKGISLSSIGTIFVNGQQIDASSGIMIFDQSGNVLELYDINGNKLSIF